MRDTKGLRGGWDSHRQWARGAAGTPSWSTGHDDRRLSVHDEQREQGGGRAL